MTSSLDQGEQVNHRAADQRAGNLYGVAAFALWGLAPAFWPLVGDTPSLEVLAHRITWSLVFAALGWAVLYRLGRIPAADFGELRRPGALGLIAIGSALITINWGVFIWAVQNEHVVESALGYYINPIISIALGVVIWRERLNRIQWSAVGLAALAVIVMTIAYGRPPWISLVLALSFACYGVVKKQLQLSAITSLVVETLFLLPFSAGYLVWLAASGVGTFGPAQPFISVMLILGGVITLLPLLLFTAAARRLPLSRIGMLQYIGPTLQFLLGVLWFGEQMPLARWVGFGLAWCALIVLSVDGGRTISRRRSSPPHKL